MSALAQTAWVTPANAQSETAAANSQNDEEGLAAIVVTAQRREQSLQKVPVAVTAITSAVLENNDVRSLKDVENISTAVNFGSGIVSLGRITIRGVSDIPRVAGIESRASIYVDGIYLGRSFVADQDIYNVDRVEVLRGPQGTLYGKNTVSGAINIVTKKPGPDFEASGELDYGSRNYLHAGGFLNVPLGEAIALSVQSSVANRDGYTTNLMDGSKLNDLRSRSGRIALKADLDPNLELLLSADIYKYDSAFGLYEAEDYTGLVKLLNTEPVASDPYVVNLTDSSSIESRLSRGLSGTVNYKFGDGWNATSITAYRTNYAKLKRVDDDYSPIDLFTTTFNQDADHFTQEFRIASPVDRPFTMLAGLYYFYQNAGQFVGVNVGPAGEALGVSGDVVFAGSVKTKSIAGYADATLRPLQDLSILAGLRYTHERKDADFYQTSTTPLFVDLSSAGYDAVTGKRTDNDVSYRAGLSYEGIKDTLIYFTHSTGFKSGGFNTDFISDLSQISGFGFRPEKVRSFELGAKSEFLNKHVRLNVTAFSARYSDYQTQQFFLPTGANVGFTAFRNAAKAQSRGLEVEALGKVSQAVTLTLNYSYTDAKFLSFPNADADGNDYSGNHLPYAPPHKLSGAVDVEIPADAVLNDARLFGHVDATYSSRFFTTDDNAIESRVDSYWFANARIGLHLADDRATISLWAKNLFDKAGPTARDRSPIGAIRVVYAEPRSFGLSVSFQK